MSAHVTGPDAEILSGKVKAKRTRAKPSPARAATSRAAKAKVTRSREAEMWRKIDVLLKEVRANSVVLGQMVDDLRRRVRSPGTIDAAESLATASPPLSGNAAIIR